jgi:hypothetical protein
VTNFPIGKLEAYCKIIGGKVAYKTKPIKKGDKEKEVKWDETFTFSFPKDPNTLIIELLDNPKKKIGIARFSLELAKYFHLLHY